MAKINKTLKPDNTIVTDLKKRHNDAKAELLVIDDKIAAKTVELEELLVTQSEEQAEKRAELQALKDKKLYLSTLVPEDTEIIGE